ncbi:hypothetical protein H0H92_009410 [Tricholoma furcatifolium]|nr:hypothetical protein H0H92_009410 [Tricholoma furcatifolium]
MTQLVKLSSGVALEVDLDAPPTAGEVNKLAICLHPWSWLGGRKDDPVLLSLLDDLQEANYYVLRYNSRGVGRSTGWSSFTGFSEAKDLEALVSWAIQSIANVKSLVFIGYSHGSLIASLQPVIPSIKTTHILISYPLGPRGWLTMFNTGTYNAKLKELVQDKSSHVLVVFGDDDEFTGSFHASLYLKLGRMPLPDERPRQSVANLIGRFENQVKRQPSSSPSSARSLSAVSHNSDSVKEEAKERREWPPRSVSPESRPPVIIPSSSFAKNLALAQAASEAALESATQADAGADSSSTPRPGSASSNADKPKPIVTTPQRQLSIGITAPTPTSPNTPTTAKPPVTAKPPPAKAPVKPSASKPPPPATSRLPTKSTTPRAPTAQTPAAQPPKPQNTAPASTSTSLRKPAIPKSVPATPISRAKTPIRTVPASTTRPKTPSTARPKTPSTGLFAPTAASLAKSRNAPPVPPTPSTAKKTTLSSSVSDRLSKPTAASLSRARSPVVPAARTSTTTKPAPTTAGRTVAAKPRASVAGNGAHAKNVAPSASAKVALAAAMAASANSIAAGAEDAASEETGAPSEENGHEEPGNENHVEEHSESGAVHPEEPLAEASGVSSSSVEPEAVHEPSNGDVAHNETDAHPVIVEPESHDQEMEADADAAPADVEEAKSRPRVGSDIEDMVNMLEAVSISKPRPQSIVSIPDEVSEIPDEE